MRTVPPIPSFGDLALVALAVLVAGCAPSAHDVAPDAVPSADAGEFGPLPEPDCKTHYTAYPGDCRAPAPPDPSEGILVHYGPTDYDDPKQIQEYVIQPGDEIVDCGYSTLENAEDFHYQRYDVYSRPGTHHVILTTSDATPTNGNHDACIARSHGSSLLAVVQGAVRGGEYHYPPSGKIAPENAGLATKLAPGQHIAYEIHAINATDQPLLREGWTIFQRMPADEVTATVGQIAFNGGLGMDIKPHTQAIIKNTCAVPGELGNIRVVDFFGHMHAHGQRFSAFVARTDSSGKETRTLVYESYDWELLDLLELNTLVTNPPVTYAGGTPGGMSGDLRLSPGDRLEYECAMNNTEDFDLKFAARATTGEMCNLFGSFTPGTAWTCVGY
ncbi:MAG TPA: hypothetical protein VHE30_16730 [Polyangiaceae bacterium]|nr:hypothetical protein [Polyangiaceae bacterium]